MHSLLALVHFVWVERSHIGGICHSQVQLHWQLHQGSLCFDRDTHWSARLSCYSCFVFLPMQHHGRTAPRFYQAPQSAISSTASQDCVLNGKTRSPLPEFEPSCTRQAIDVSENHDNVPYKPTKWHYLLLSSTYQGIKVSRSRQEIKDTTLIKITMKRWIPTWPSFCACALR